MIFVLNRWQQISFLLVCSCKHFTFASFHCPQHVAQLARNICSFARSLTRQSPPLTFTSHAHDPKVARAPVLSWFVRALPPPPPPPPPSPPPPSSVEGVTAHARDNILRRCASVAAAAIAVVVATLSLLRRRTLASRRSA